MKEFDEIENLAILQNALTAVSETMESIENHPEIGNDDITRTAALYLSGLAHTRAALELVRRRTEPGYREKLEASLVRAGDKMSESFAEVFRTLYEKHEGE